MSIKIQHKKIKIPQNLKTIFSNNHFDIFSDKKIHEIILKNKNKILYVGNFFYDNNKYKSIKHLLNSFIIKNKNIYQCIEKLKDNLNGRFLMIYADIKKSNLKLFSDLYGRYDCFYHTKKNKFEISTDLSFFAESPSSEGYNQVGLAHLLSVYGSRPAKKDTIYKNVHRLGVGEVINIQNRIFKIKKIKFKPKKTKNFNDSDLEKYSNLFLKSLKKNGSNRSNIVYLSSGWDSTSILAGLVHIFGSKKIKAVIGRMRYSKRSSIINIYEIKKAKKIAKYFNVPLEIVELDYTKKIPKVIDKILIEMKKRCIYSGTIGNHGILANKARKMDKNASIFCGEISDGSHNLGFSQFTSIFHKSKNFREYSDKISSYFYGPTFMKIYDENNHLKDELYNFYKSLNPNLTFQEKIRGNKSKSIQQLLSSFFLQNKRLPLVSGENELIFTKKGYKNYYKVMQKKYLDDASKKINYDNLYSWYLHLYNSFHWQSSTVSTISATSDIFNLNLKLPFYDIELQNFLSEMPEHFGRGLDLNPTKYPLKWTLKNKLDYPFHLQNGPHAYLYDTNPSFNLSVERVNYSAHRKIFKKVLQNHPYKKILSPEVFNIKRIEKIVKKYLNDQEIIGEELSILTPLCLLFYVGIY